MHDIEDDSPGPPGRIREYHADDREAVLAVWEAASAVGHPFLSEQFLATERHNVAHHYLPVAHTWVWEAGGRVVGFIALVDNEVGGLFVDPEMHGRGIGRALVEHARALRGELGVEVFEDNSLARAFYRACGFVETQKGIHEETGLAVLRLALPAAEPAVESPEPDGPVEVAFLGASDLQLLHHVAPDVFDNEVDPRRAREFLEDPRHHLAVARAGESVVGMASAVHYVHPDKPPELWIDEVAVSPAHRGRGVGRRLLEALFSRGRALGCRSAWVLTEDDNPGAMALYRGVGGQRKQPDPVMFEFDLEPEPEPTVGEEGVPGRSP